MTVQSKIKNLRNKGLYTHNQDYDDEDIDLEEEIDETARGEFGDSFRYEDENGYWENNVIFNEDGFPIDEDGKPLTEDDEEDDDEFDYSQFYQPPVYDNEVDKDKNKQDHKK